MQIECQAHIVSPDYTSDLKINIEDKCKEVIPDNHEVTEVCPHCDSESDTCNVTRLNFRHDNGR